MFYPKKSLGQNFLINESVLPKIISAAEIKKGDIIIEIGPGFGILTEVLLENGAKVYAIEKDFDLVAKLTKIFKNNKNLKIIHQDALFFEPSGFKKYKVVANLPFNIAAPLIRKFLEEEFPPTLMVLMVQKEIAQKILASPGDSERGVLTLAVEYYAEAEMIAQVSKTSFAPSPKVDAAIIKLIKPKLHLRSVTYKVKPEFFFKIVKAGFSAKRRQIHNSLAATLRIEKSQIFDILKKSEISPRLRAEDLTLGQWLGLCQTIANNDILKLNDQSSK